VESALTDLGTFLYTEIANVPGAAPRAALEPVGADSLLSFARKVNALPPYKRLPRKPEPGGPLGFAVWRFLRAWCRNGCWLLPN